MTEDTNAYTRGGDATREEIRQANERPVPMPCSSHRWRLVSLDPLTRRQVDRCVTCGELRRDA